MIDDVWVIGIGLLCFCLGFLARGEFQRLRKERQEAKQK